MDPGTRLGPYEVVSRIGAGGMGEVYKARDTRLDRSVAIKVLPKEFARNSQLKVRFEREAKAISQLNHPHICTLYDVGDDYLVMELLEGETLAHRLEKGALPLADVLKFGAQIADALDRAHKAGIVHRDLKPGNIMITKAGAKLLDFGLAKTAVQPIDPNSATVKQDNALTQEGTILGTFQYMAPEQLEAEEADARTDIFALGAVLYEMATGRRAFQGKTRTSLIAAIVAGQPQPVSQLIPLSPPGLDHVIQKCLEKDREDRWQSAHDVAEELKWIASTPVEQKVRGVRGSKLAIAAAVLLALALAAMTAMYVRARNAPKPRTAFAILPPKGLSFDTARYGLSPDGTMIAFGSYNSKREGGLWLRRLDDLEAKRLTTHADDRFMTWSPDSKSIAYTTRGPNGLQFMKIAASGGTPEVIAPSVTHIGHAAWSPDGTILFSAGIGVGISAIRPGMHEPIPVTVCDRKRRESFHASQRFLSDGRRFLYLVHTIASQKNEIWAASTDGKLKQQVFRADGLVGLAQGNIYFVRDGAIYAQRFDENELKLVGEPRRIVERVHFEEESGVAFASVAKSGALLYLPPSQRRVEWAWYDRNGRRIEKIFDDVELFARALSLDGKRVVATGFEPSKGANDIWIVDLERGLKTRLTSGLAEHGNPQWSPSGDRVYFDSDRDGPYDVYSQAEDGASPPVAIWKSGTDKRIEEIMPAGDALVVSEWNGGQRDLWLVPVGAPEKRRAIVASEADEVNVTLSPDGRWVAYHSDRSGRRELYMRRLEGGPTTQISTNGANGCVWGRNGTAVYMRGLDGARYEVPLTFAGDRVVPGTPALLFTAPAPSHAIFAHTAKGFFMWTVPDPADYIIALHYDSAPLQ